MVFPPWMFARLGELVTDIRNEDIIKEVERHAREREEYARKLEQERESLLERYRELAAYAAQLVEYTRSVERERNDLSEECSILQVENGRMREVIDELRKTRDRFRDEADGIRGEIDRLRDEGAKILAYYGAMRTILRNMMEHAGRLFTSEFTADQRQKLARFLDQLPD